MMTVETIMDTRTIIVYEDRNGKQRQHGPTTATAVDIFLRLTKRFRRTKVLYLVHCRRRAGQ